MNNQKTTKFIGIDPAARANGFAVCVIDTVEKTATLIRFADTFDFPVWLKSEAPDSAFVCVENSGRTNATFRKHKDPLIRDAMGRRAGANIGVSKNTVKALHKKYGEHNVLDISPRQKGRVIKDMSLFLRMVHAEGLTVIKDKRKKILEDDMVAFHMARIAQQQYVMYSRAGKL